MQVYDLRNRWLFSSGWEVGVLSRKLDGGVDDWSMSSVADKLFIATRYHFTVGVNCVTVLDATQSSTLSSACTGAFCSIRSTLAVDSQIRSPSNNLLRFLLWQSALQTHHQQSPINQPPMILLKTHLNSIACAVLAGF